MIPWQLIGEARAPGGEVLTLHRRGDEFVIRAGGRELMGSRAHGSEEELARLACAHVAGAGARVLIGGLGMGFSLAAALAVVGDDAVVRVAEISDAVVEWNRGPLAPLAGRPLEDPRVEVEVADVGALLRATTVRYDAVLLDVDNGPEGLTRDANHALYTDAGLACARRALRPGGCYALWSAARHPDFERRLRRAGFQVEARGVRARGGSRVKHTIYLGRTPAWSWPTR